MTPNAFGRAGKKLFGKKWKAPLARALDLDPATIWRYTTGDKVIPVVVALAVDSLLVAQGKRVEEILKRPNVRAGASSKSD